MSAMARWPARPSTRVSANEQPASTSVALPAASASGISSSGRRFPITSSTRNLPSSGRTRAAADHLDRALARGMTEADRVAVLAQPRIGLEHLDDLVDGGRNQLAREAEELQRHVAAVGRTRREVGGVAQRNHAEVEVLAEIL